MNKSRALCFLVVSAFLSGCYSFAYGPAFSRPVPANDVATLIVYRHDTSALAPVGKAPLPFEVDGVAVSEPLNPHGYKIITVSPGKKILNAKTGLIDLRREVVFEAGKLYYIKASCYYVVTEAFCKIEPVADSMGADEVAGLRESQGNAEK